MYFDKARNVYVDVETGNTIPILEGDILPIEGASHSQPQHYNSYNTIATNSYVNITGTDSKRSAASTATIAKSKLEEGDHRLAMQLAKEYELATRSTSSNPVPDQYEYRHSTYATSPNKVNNTHITATTPIAMKNKSGNFFSRISPSTAFNALSSRGNSPAGTFDAIQEDLIHQHLHSQSNVSNGNNNRAIVNDSATTEGGSDWSLAKYLQAMEFEIDPAELEAHAVGLEFNRKEYSASSCSRQIFCLSTLICVIQIILVIVMIQQDGYAPMSQNPMLGPPVTTLVRFGAKNASLQIYLREWWRLLSAIMLHAGIYHLVSNVIIQLRVGGYLNAIYGTPKWLTIYLLSGIFGNMTSTCFLPESVGVGSSGAVLGMLTSWIVWIVFRWKKIPRESHGLRNCQLLVVLVSVAITLGMSFSSYVDWCAHFGGAVQGFLLAIAFLGNELDNAVHRFWVRLVSIIIIVVLFIVEIWYMAAVLRPSRQVLQYWDQNDQ